MARLSPAPVVFTLFLSLPSVAQGPFLSTDLSSEARSAEEEAQSAKVDTCDPEFLNRESYRLTTDAQAMNVTRPRTNWWDGFDASLRTHQDALGDLNDAARTIAERALDLDPRNQLAHSQLARQLVILGEDGARARQEIETLFKAGGALAWTATLYDVDAKSFFIMGFDREGIRVFRFSGDHDRWWHDTRTYSGIGIGPSSYQDRIRHTLVTVIDPNGRIKLPKQKRGAGW